MRLTSIKLAGFKSFVDPTVVSFPGNLCAIVGPNGCGKSNIIDAVRWVMGESSARQLRGENSTDVIFNGSAGRKPTALASIELSFDNSDGRIGGEYAKYAEIEVRRQVTRDGQSTYFLNGQRCRRRDILDVFLGTGFGPRSYSIIEQGMISEIVEAKPEELRVYLEEAAGISKYKERRRETENRIRHTRDNLDRLGDLREELGRQIAHLERQAQAAERFKALSEEAASKRLELAALRWQELGEQVAVIERAIREREVELERLVTEQTHNETESDRERVALAGANDRFNAVQGRFYALGAEVARAEQELASRAQRRRELDNELADIAARTASTAVEQSREVAQLATEDTDVAALAPQLIDAQSRDGAASTALANAEAAAESARRAFDDAVAAHAEHQRRVDVAASRVEHQEQLILRLETRLQTLAAEYARLDTAQQAGEVHSLDSQVADIEQQLQATRAQVDALAVRQAAAVDGVAAGETAVASARQRFQEQASEYASVHAVQQAALGRRDSSALGWLADQGLADQTRLGEVLRVADGVERAVETVLGGALRAVVVDDIAAAVSRLDAFGQGDVMLVEGRRAATAVDAAPRDGSRELPRLQNFVQWDRELAALLAEVYLAEDLPTALRARATLTARQSIVTRDGVWLGADWLRVSRGVQAESGILERAQWLDQLRRDVDGLAAALEAAEVALGTARRQQRDLEVERAALAEALVEGNRRLGALRADVSGQRARLDALQAQRQRIELEQTELHGQIAEERNQCERTRSELTALEHEASARLEARSATTDARDAAQAALGRDRARLTEVREALHALQLHAQSAQARRNAAADAVARLSQLAGELADRQGRLLQARDETLAPVSQLEAERDRAMHDRTGVEGELGAARQTIEDGNERLRTLEEARSRAARQAGETRAALEAQRLQWQDLRTRRGGLADQVAELGERIELLAPKLPSDASITHWEADLGRLEQRIARLGAINLAAIEEFEAARERKDYLDEQTADLETALAVLGSAIREIDGETRTRFKDTFEQVNERLKELFPKVFGGGSAELELTGEDLLDTGVSLMARPPGKRNASIHLLSGGEKALTAISLIMAIFHLNPSPVCLLDEVDAPLDDANVGRYANLIREMSSEVQFIFVTHNKIAMEMADQLMGVTMQEPGVSRMVSVDVGSAVALAGQ